MSNNSLSGSIPVEVVYLDNLVELDLAENRLSGEISSSLASCISLERLYLEGNAFEGTIPLSLKSLRGLEEIDLSRNNLSGQIPEFLSKILFLKHLNLSHNDFDGEVSQAGIFGNASAFSVVGNNKLCGGVQDLHLPTCTRKSPGRRLAPKVVIPVTGAVIFVVLLLCSYASYHRESDYVSQAKGFHGVHSSRALPGHVMDIVDRSMLFEEENVHKKVRGNREDYVEERALIKNQNSHVSSVRRREECLISMMKIGLSCAATLPSERLTMTVVVNNLLDIKAMLVAISGF
ncbi:hypothetical protein QUC31_011451 [Theobroma cacao]